MSNRTVVLGSLVGMVGLAFVVVVLAAGCQKEKPAPGANTTQAKGQQSPAPMKHEAMSMPMKEEAPAPAQQTSEVAEQTTCPVMDGPINKAIFVEYQGKKVYFCCNGCPDAFKADPAKYISKLPQFAK